MVYKKYIKRNGKTYGPYIYQSRRVNGKVISEYHGTGKHDYKQFIFPAFVFLFIIMLLFISSNFFNLNGKITGEAISEQNLDIPKENTGERLSLSLKEGELIPASSKVVFETANETIEYSLKDLISEEPASGNYYIAGKSLSGEGEGYGMKGTKTIFPKIYFTLISSQIQAEEPEESAETHPESGETTENKTEEEEGNASEMQNQSSQNQTETGGISETTANNETETEENSTQTSETPEQPAESDNPETTSETPEQLAETTESEGTEEPAGSSEQNTLPESPSETGNSEETSAPITGGVITGIFNKIFNFFLGMGFTGKTISEPITAEISGEVSADAPFVYDIKKGESVELLSGSVKTDSENMSDNLLKISSQEDNVLVETEYSESEEGFGENYSGIKEKILYLNLSGFNLSSDILGAKIFYNDAEIFDLMANRTGQSNMTDNESEKHLFNAENLTAEEKEFLAETFGNSSVQTIKSELFNGRYIIGYQLGDYGIEYSYDSNLDNETLILNMESDRIKWIRNIINELSREKSIPQEVNQFIPDYSFGGDIFQEDNQSGLNSSSEENVSQEANQPILNDSAEEQV